MAQLTKQQVREIIQNRPRGTSPEGIVAALRTQGHQLEGYPQQAQPQNPGLLSHIGSGIKNAFDYATAPVDLAVGALEKGVEGITGKDIFNKPYQASNQIPENLQQTGDIAPLVGGAVGSAFGPIGTGAGTAIGKGVDNLIDEIQGTRPVDMGLIPSNDILGPVAEGAVAGALHLGANKVAGMAKGAIQARKSKQVTQLVQPKATEAVIQKANEEGRLQAGTLLRKGKITPTAQEEAIADTVRKLPGVGGKNLVKNTKAIKEGITSLSDEVGRGLEAKDTIFSKKVLRSAINKNKQFDKDAIFGSDLAKQNEYQRILNIWDKVSEPYQGKVSELWKARKAFDKRITELYGQKVFDAERDTVRAAAVRNVRQAVNGFINDVHPEFQGQLDELSRMFQAVENISSKAGTKTLRSGVQKVLDTRAGKIGTSAAIGGAAAAGGFGAYSALSQ